MLQVFKLWRLKSALQSKGNPQEAYGAVVELGRLGGDRALELLIGALGRKDGVARSAARELGRNRDPRALKPLASLLENPDASQAAAEALIAFGAPAVDVLVEALKNPDAHTRRLAAAALGDIADKRAVEPLALVAQSDEDYAVRTAAVAALGELKDPRAVWAIVAVLKLRDETAPEQQAALEQLRQAANLSLRKLGDPLKGGDPATIQTLDAAVRQIEAAIKDSDIHPRLIGDLALVGIEDLVGVLKELITASEEISWANLERREPLLPAWFKTYDQRAGAAQIVGKELQRRGGTALMRKIFEEDLGSYAALNNWWSGTKGWD